MSFDRPKTPESWDELVEALHELERAVHDPEAALEKETESYGKSVIAMATAGYLAHEWFARILGVTGFQHSISSLSVVGMLRGMEGPYMLLDGADGLWPQYDTAGKVAEWLTSDNMRNYLADQAEAKLDALQPSDLVAGPVEEHWRKLVADRPAS